MSIRVSITVALIFAALCCARAQSGDGAKPATDAQGSIKGRVTDEAGQPLAGANIFARSLRNHFVNATTDDEGEFTLDNVERGPYSLWASLPGYYDSSLLAGRRGALNYYHRGDRVTIRLARGGVITGRVTNGAGEPLIAAPVIAARVRDEEGHAISELTYSDMPQRQTDDRGVYRIYGLLPGAYVVSAGGRGLYTFNPRPAPYDDDVLTYYPSTTRDGAVEVVVEAGQEVPNIDIRYRGEKGHAASGEVAGGAGDGGNVNVRIASSATQAVLGYRYISPVLKNFAFVFDGLADGEYDLTAEKSDQAGAVSAAGGAHIAVRGADVTGIRITLTPLASISGHVTLEGAPADVPWRSQCRTKLDAVAGETAIIARREREKMKAQAPTVGSKTSDTSPDDKGDFTLRSLAAGRFRLDVRPPGGDWYVRSAALASPNAGAATKAGDASQKAPAASANPLSDGLTLAGGAQVSGLTLTLAPGAAALRGRVVAAAGEGTPLPALRLYLVPAERERAGDALRYAVAQVNPDGTFALTNLAPGRYNLVLRPAPSGENADDGLAPAFPDEKTRDGLRREAESAKSIELQPCRQLGDYVLQYAPR
jgi:hypothetical protein